MSLIISPDAAGVPLSLLAQRPTMVPGTYYIQTWGCQMNEEDSEQMALYLRDLGYKQAISIQEAQVILLNTCSVRKKPEDKAFSMLGELAALKHRNPSVIIGVCGCMAQARADEIRQRAPHVDFVLGTGDLGQLPTLVLQSAESRRFRKVLGLPERKGRVVTDVPQRHLGRAHKLKAFVPIQYGCDKFCTYCIVPQTRGRERSRPTKDILEEIRALAENGTKEVTLLGQTVNSYGKNLSEGQVPFAELLWQINEISGIERIRYTSPYPRDFRTDLIETIRDCPTVMEHVHLPLQSGNDEILRQMKRVYTVGGYGEIVEQLRETVPGITITTDMIVGFPGETESQFHDSLDAMRKFRFDGAFMFAYSTRPGTPAGDRTDQTEYKAKMRRLNEMIALQNQITLEANLAQVGKAHEVLIECASPKNPNRLQGYSREFRMMHFEADASRIGRTARIMAKSSHQYGLVGELIESNLVK